jgi:hypothetical protein
VSGRPANLLIQLTRSRRADEAAPSAPIRRLGGTPIGRAAGRRGAAQRCHPTTSGRVLGKLKLGPTGSCCRGGDQFAATAYRWGAAGGARGPSARLGATASSESRQRDYLKQKLGPRIQFARVRARPNVEGSRCSPPDGTGGDCVASCSGAGGRGIAASVEPPVWPTSEASHTHIHWTQQAEYKFMKSIGRDGRVLMMCKRTAAVVVVVVCDVLTFDRAARSCCAVPLHGASFFLSCEPRPVRMTRAAAGRAVRY